MGNDYDEFECAWYLYDVLGKDFYPTRKKREVFIVHAVAVLAGVYSPFVLTILHTTIIQFMSFTQCGSEHLLIIKPRHIIKRRM
jgi:hypothetical protein